MNQADEVKVANPETQKTINKQEGVRIGKLLVLSKRDYAALENQRDRFLAKGYQIDKTAHFTICKQQSSNQIILLHTFPQDEINADLICFIEQELSPFGVFSSMRDFGAALFAVMASVFPAPRHQPSIWRHFCVNSLNKLRDQMRQPPLDAPAISYITPFATIYRRIAELSSGNTILDVGSSFGFFPILIAERCPEGHFSGCDNNPDAISLAEDLAMTVGIQHVKFDLRDVLASDFIDIGCFDTVAAIHLLEHLAEEQLPQAMKHLLQVTRKRLIIAVPYEEQATPAYGHLQVFTPQKLDNWGKWCVDQLHGQARYWCENVMGGLLVVELR